jgi:hypothetical protein
VQSLPAVTPITINMNGVSDTLTVDSTAYASTVTANLGSGTETVNIEGTGDAVTVYDGSGSDTVNISPTAQDLSTLGGDVTVIGGGGTGTVNVNDQGHQDLQGGSNYWLTASSVRRTNSNTVYFFGQSRVEIYGASGNEIYHVGTEENGPIPAPQGAAANGYVALNTTGTGSDRISVVDAFYTDANNHLRFTLDGLDGFHVNGHAGDRLVVDNTGTFPLPTGTTINPQTFTLTTDPVSDRGVTMAYSGSGPGSFFLGLPSLTYSGIDTLEIDGGSPGEKFRVGDGSNNLDALPKTVDIVGAGGDSLTINDQPNATNALITQTTPTFTITSQSVTRSNAVTYVFNGHSGTGTATSEIDYGGVANVEVDGGSSGNIFDVQSTAAGTPVTIRAGAGSDTINVGDASNTLGGIQGALTVNGQGANTKLDVNDSGNNVSENYTVSPAMIQRSIIVAGVYNFNIASINYSQVGHVAVYVGSAQTGVNEGAADYNTLDVVGTALGTVTDLYGNNNGGQTAFAAYPYVFTYAGPILGAVHFHGSSIGLDTMSYVDYFGPGAQTYTMTAGQMVDNGFAPVTYDGRFYGVGLETSVLGGSKVNVLSTAPAAAIGIGTQVQVNTGDVVTVGSQAPNLGGSLAGLAASGILSIHTLYASSAASVILDDSADTQTGKQVTFQTDVSSVWEVDGLASQVIELTLSTGSKVQVLGGSPAAGQTGGNTYDIQSTPAGTALTVKAGRGTDTINVGGATAESLDSILGSVTVTGQGVNTTLNYNDQNTTAANYYWYNVSANSLSRVQVLYTSSGQSDGPPMASINYTGIGTLNVHAHNAGAGAGASYWSVTGTAQGTTTNADAGAGMNEFFVGSNAYTLDGFQGPLYLHGSGSGYPNNNLVFIQDILDPKPRRFLLTAGQTSESGVVQRFDLGSSQPDATINYDGMNSYAVLSTANSYSASSSHNDTVDVQGNAADLWTIVAVGTGDTVNVGTPAHTMDGISGDLRIQATAGQTPTVNLDDSRDTANRTIDLADEGPYGYRVTGLLSPGNPVRGRIWLLDPAENVTIKTGSGNDIFRVHDFKEAPALTLDGGGGNNTLDYSAYQGDVMVDLPHGFATGFVGISGIENVTGSQGNNLIVGNNSARSLIGGTGRNVLIGGGGGNVTLDASRSAGDNILIGGTIQFETQQDALAALDAIFAEWTRTDLSFDDRLSDLEFGSNSKGATPKNRLTNGMPILLKAATVKDDSSPDTMTGGAGQNWFFVDPRDNLTNYKPGQDQKTVI